MDDEGPGAEYPYFLFFLDVSLPEVRIYKNKVVSGGKRDYDQLGALRSFPIKTQNKNPNIMISTLHWVSDFAM